MTSSGPFRFPPEARQVRLVRQHVRERAGLMGAAESVCDAVTLIVDELVNNAIEHGASYRRAQDPLSIALGLESGQLTIEFLDPEMPETAVRELANALKAAADGTPSLDSERGRGLFLISVYMEEVRIEVAASGGLRLLGRLSAN